MCLPFREVITLDQSCFCSCTAFSFSDDFQHIIQVLKSDHQAFKQVHLFFSLAEFVACTSGYYFNSVLQEKLQQLWQGQHLWLPVHNGKHDDAET